MNKEIEIQIGSGAAMIGLFVTLIRLFFWPAFAIWAVLRITSVL